MKTLSLLRNERIRRGWDLQELGFYAQIPAQHISVIERGLQPCGPRRGQRICKVLGMNYAEIFHPTGIARGIDETL